MLRLRSLTLAVILLHSVSALNAAIIDSFSVPTTDQSVTSSSGNNFGAVSITQTGLSTTEVIGGERFFSARTISFPQRNDPTARVTATMNGTQGNFDNTFIAQSHGNGSYTAETTIIWGNTNDLNFDLGTDNGFLLTLEDINLSPINLINASLELTLETGGGTDSITLALLDGMNMLQPEYVFAGFTGVDLMDIDTITLTLRATTNNASSDFTVTYGAFATTFIPEPSSYLLIGLTALGAIIVARRRIKAGDQIAA